MGAEGARGLVVLHDTAVVQDLAAVIIAGVLILEQGLGLLLTDDGRLHLRGVHVHIQLPTHQQAHGGRKLGLGLQDLRRLLLDDERAAGDTSDQTVARCWLREESWEAC